MMTKRQAKAEHKKGTRIQYTGGQFSIGKWTDIVIPFPMWNFDNPGEGEFRYRLKPKEDI